MLEITVTADDLKEFSESGKFENLTDLIDVIGPQSTLKLIQAYGGSHLYIPILNNLGMEKRNRIICSQFHQQGTSYKQLSRQYHLTESSIRRIVDGC